MARPGAEWDTVRTRRQWLSDTQLEQSDYVEDQFVQLVEVRTRDGPSLTETYFGRKLAFHLDVRISACCRTRSAGHFEAQPRDGAAIHEAIVGPDERFNRDGLSRRWIRADSESHGFPRSECRVCAVDDAVFVDVVEPCEFA